MKPKNRKSNPLSAVLQKLGYLKWEKRVPFDSEWNAHEDGCVEVNIHPYWCQQTDDIYWMLSISMLDDESYGIVWPNLEELLVIWNKIECGITRDDIRKLGLEY